MQKLRCVALDFQLAVGDGGIDHALANDFAHGGLGGVAHHLGLIGDVEQVLHRILDLVLHAELHIDDVFIPGEHGRLLGDGAHLPLLEGRPLPHGAETHLAAQHLRDLGLVHFFNGVGQVVVGAGVHRAHIPAEAQHNALLVWIDDVDARQDPQQRKADDNQPQPSPRGHTLPQQLFRPGTPAAAAATTASAIAIVPFIAALAALAAPARPETLAGGIVLTIVPRAGSLRPPLPFFL